MKDILIFSLFFLLNIFTVDLKTQSNKNLKAELNIKFQGPSAAYQGENIKDSIKILIKNNGKKIAENFFLDIYIKKGKEKEVLCGRSFISSVNPSENIYPSGLIPIIPLDLEPGTYKICAFVDSENSVEEENEENNKSCQKIQVFEKKNLRR